MSDNLIEYTQWQNNHSEELACSGTNNPAFNSFLAPRSDLMQALATCAGCPVINECKQWSKTSLFRDFDGVMGGNVKTFTRSEKKNQAIENVYTQDLTALAEAC